jgi:hypothetical protein
MSLDHFLPVTYLKNFSENPSAGRKATVWRFDGKQSLPVQIGSECARESHYSKLGDKGMFDTLENWYGTFMLKNSTEMECSFGKPNTLLAFILHVHFRGVGVSYQNQTGKENKHAYFGLTEELGNILGFPEELNPREYLKHLNNVWRTKIVGAAEPELRTSDSPVICYGKSTCVDVLILPISPELCAVGFNRFRFNVVSDVLSLKDENRLQQAQLKICSGNIYTRSRLSSEQEQSIREDGEIFKKPPGRIDGSTVKLNALVFPKEPYDFLMAVTPFNNLKTTVMG